MTKTTGRQAANGTGAFVMEVHPTWAPFAVARFVLRHLIPCALRSKFSIPKDSEKHSSWVRKTSDTDNSWLTTLCYSFKHLVDGNYFDNMRFHKARSGFASQFGIAADPKQTKYWSKRTIYDEGPEREVSLNEHKSQLFDIFAIIYVVSIQA